MKQIKTMQADNISIESVNEDAGLTVSCQCPTCKEIIRVAEYGWWSQECSCGIKWELNLSVTGSQ